MDEEEQFIKAYKRLLYAKADLQIAKNRLKKVLQNRYVQEQKKQEMRRKVMSILPRKVSEATREYRDILRQTGLSTEQKDELKEAIKAMSGLGNYVSGM